MCFLWLDELVSERPSESFTSGGFLNFFQKASPLALPSESFTTGGFLKEASPLALPSESARREATRA
jgi:hypothetical protein